MAAPKDYYKILGVDEKADEKAIKEAFRRLARQYHPDVSGKAGEEKFKEINEAYEVLSDPQKRAEYDQMRRGYAFHQARSRGPGFQRVDFDWNPRDFADWSTLFEDLFQSDGGFSHRWETHTAQAEETVRLTLEQVATGATIPLTVNTIRECPVCHGRDRDCPRCGGLGQVAEPRRFDVKVPPGVEDGAVLRVGDYARLKVEVEPHARFKRQGDDLIGELMVSVPLAATGGELSILPLVGKPVTVTIPPHTNHGKVLRLRGLGLPRRGSQQRGDMLLEVTLRFPEPFTAADDEHYQALRAIHHEGGGEIHAPR